MEILYLGPEGTFTDMAARRYFGGSDEHEFHPRPDIGELAREVDENDGLWGVIPIENSLEGSVNLTLDLLAHEIDVKIGAEMNLRINHYLIGKNDQNPAEIRRIISHPQALAQCRQNLNRIISGKFETEPISSTAAAVSELKKRDNKTAAIGTRRAAENNDLEILVEQLQDNTSNWTRFILIGPEDRPDPGHNETIKTSLISIPVEDRPGILYEILEEFAVRELNLTKIESRPTRRELGEYLFFIDFEGSRYKEEADRAIAGVEEKSSRLKILGSYPVYENNYGKIETPLCEKTGGK